MGAIVKISADHNTGRVHSDYKPSSEITAGA